MKVMGNPVEHFSIPHPAPPACEEASAKFEKISADFQAARARFYALKASRLDDIAAANLAAANARVEGTKPPALTPAKIDANIAKAETEMNVLSEACDLAHTALLEAVAEHRDEWIKVYEAAEAEATGRADELMALQQKAMSDLGCARAAARWLREFKPIASQSQGPGGGHTMADFSELEKLVHGELVLVGYRDGGPIWERKGGPKS